MGFVPIRDSGFLDGVWRPSSKDPSPNRDFRSCRFGIGLHRSMDGPESSGEDLREFAVSVAGTSSTRDFHRFKGPRGGRWYGLELEMIPLCGCVCASWLYFRYFSNPSLFCETLLLSSRLKEPPWDWNPGKYSYAFRMMT